MLKKYISLAAIAISLLFCSNAAVELVGLLQKEGKTLGYVNLDIDAMEALPILSSTGILPMGGKVEYVHDEIAENGTQAASTLQNTPSENAYANINLDVENFGWVAACDPQKAEDFHVLGEGFEKGLIVRYRGRDGSCQEGGVYFWLYNPSEG